jgi:hypothetical protein
MRLTDFVTTTTYSAIGPSRHHWQPGLQHLPWKGLGALILSLAGVIVSATILLVSNGDDVGRWKFQPTVYLSIASTVTNIAHTYALFEGVTVAWWHKALKDGTTVADLHRVWSFGNSFLAAVWAGRHFNWIALASILVAISPVNGPLLQRASTITNATVSSQQDFKLQVNQLVPRGFTAIVSSRAESVNMLTTDFAPIARAYYSRAQIPLQSDCIGTCRTAVLGAGFHTNCSSYRQPYNISYDFLNTTIFEAQLLFNVGDTPTMASLNVAYKPEAGCLGELSVSNCTLRAGTVQYPIVVDGVSSTVSLAPNSTIWDDTVVGDPDYLGPEGHLTGTTTYGGIFLALANQYDTSLAIQFSGAIGFEYLGAQSEASISYAQNIDIVPSCNISFTNPLDDFLQGARELIFRTAVATANSSNEQQVQTQASGAHTVYRTEYLFLALATLVSLLAIFSVLWVFYGFWDIGRPVSMSPIETAKAFNAPVLKQGDSNAPANELLRQVGAKQVKYGIVSDARGGGGSTTSVESSLYHDSPYSGAPDTAYTPGILRRHSTYHNPSGSDFELLAPGAMHGVANTRLELADPQKVVSL